MKKIIILLIICILICLNVSASFANAGISADNIIFNNEEQEDMQKLIEKVNAHMQSIENANSIQTERHKMLSVPKRKQINASYCGPASVRMVLLYFDYDVKQEVLAQKMGTTEPGGTSPSRILDGLVPYLGGGAYKTVETKTIPFSDGLEYSIDNDTPVICCLMTGKLPLYREEGKDTGHYLVAKGYYCGMQGDTGGQYVRYNDPNNDSRFYGEHDAKWSEMTEAINDGGGYYYMKRG